jgi:hypothetical protein
VYDTSLQQESTGLSPLFLIFPSFFSPPILISSLLSLPFLLLQCLHFSHLHLNFSSPPSPSSSFPCSPLHQLILHALPLNRAVKWVTLVLVFRQFSVQILT